jgi:hypothetical protein
MLNRPFMRLSAAWYEEAHMEAYLQIISDLAHSPGKAARA